MRAYVSCAVLAALSCAGRAAAAGHADHDAERGIVALDVHSAGALVDVLTVVSDAAGKRLHHWRSQDGGRTWGETHALPLGSAGIHGAHRGNDPQIAAFGNQLVAVWTRPGTSSYGSGPLATALSDDGGVTWKAGANPADDGSTGGHAYADLTVDAAGAFYLVWLDSRDGAQGLRAAVSRDYGRTWSPNKTADAQTCECCLNRLASPRAGEAWALYRDKGPRDMAVAVSADGANTWSRRGVAGSFGWQFEGCPHVGGGLAFTAGGAHAAVWTGAAGRIGFYAVSSNDGGRTWGQPARLGGENAHHGDIAAAQGLLAAAWDDRADGGALYAATSRDDGRTWSAPTRLSAPGTAASHPVLAGTQDGVLVAWTERIGAAPLRFASVRLDGR